MGKILLIVLAVSFLLFRLILAAQLELAPDEAYYWYWSKNLDLSYYDHPPLIAYLIAAGTFIGGDTELFVRLGGFLASLAILVFVALTVNTLFPSRAVPAWEVICLLIVTPLLAAGSVIQTPDTPLLFFWSLGVYAASRIIRGHSPRFWYLWGAALGLGLLSKYTMIIFVPCFFAYLLLCCQAGRWLKRKEPYLAIILALVIFSPVILWNLQHDWVSFGYQLNQGFALRAERLPAKLLEYAGGQAGIITPLLFGAFVFYSLKALRWETDEARPYLFLLLLSWPVILLFAGSSLVGKVAEANWPAPAYLAGLILTWAVYHRQYRERPGHRYFMRAAAGLACLLTLIVHIHLVQPFLPWPPRDDTTQQFHGWRELGAKIDRVRTANPQASGYFLLSDRGTTLAEGIFYSSGRLAGRDPDFPQRYLFLHPADFKPGMNAVILLHETVEEKMARYRKYFKSFEKVDTHLPVFRGESMDHLKVEIFLGREYRGGWIR